MELILANRFRNQRIRKTIGATATARHKYDRVFRLNGLGLVHTTLATNGTGQMLAISILFADN